MTIIPHLRLGIAAPSQDDTLLSEQQAGVSLILQPRPCVGGGSFCLRYDTLLIFGVSHQYHDGGRDLTAYVYVLVVRRQKPAP